MCSGIWMQNYKMRIAQMISSIRKASLSFFFLSWYSFQFLFEHPWNSGLSPEFRGRLHSKKLCDLGQAPLAHWASAVFVEIIPFSFILQMWLLSETDTKLSIVPGKWCYSFVMIINFMHELFIRGFMLHVWVTGWSASADLMDICRTKLSFSCWGW